MTYALCSLSSRCFSNRPQNGGRNCEGSDKGLWKMCNTQVRTELLTIYVVNFDVVISLP